MAEIRQTPEYANWFRKLRDHKARARIIVRIRRISLGNFGDVKSVGKGVSELRIPFGPAYRIYFTRKSGEIVLLLCGGDKSSRQRDIGRAHELARKLRQ